MCVMMYTFGQMLVKSFWGSQTVVCRSADDVKQIRYADAHMCIRDACICSILLGDSVHCVVEQCGGIPWEYSEYS